MAKRASNKPTQQARPSTAPLSPPAAQAAGETPPEGYGVSPPAVPSLDATHPAIALAQAHQTGAGSTPKKAVGRYVLPPPPEILKSV